MCCDRDPVSEQKATIRLGRRILLLCCDRTAGVCVCLRGCKNPWPRHPVMLILYNTFLVLWVQYISRLAHISAEGCHHLEIMSQRSQLPCVDHNKQILCDRHAME